MRKLLFLLALLLPLCTHVQRLLWLGGSSRAPTVTAALKSAGVFQDAKQ